jgi:succinoglycan biosynthesis protein ExoO
LIRTGLIRDNGLRYDGRLRIAEDYDFILRLLLLGARFRVYPQPGYFYRKHGGSVSHRLSCHTLQPMLAAHEQLQQAVAGQDAGLDSAMAARRASLRRALEFDALVVALKRAAWRQALSLVVRRPSLLSLLRQATFERLHRLCAGFVHAPAKATAKATAGAGTRRQVHVLSRQRVIGNTNGSSVYLLALCTALDRAGCDVHLIGPSPTVFGRWPAMMLRPEMRVIRTIRLRRSLRLGPLLLATDPATLRRAAVGGLGKLASRLGFATERLNRPAPYAIAQPWTRADLLFIARHARRADVVIADYAFLADGIPYALCPNARSLVIMHDLFSSRSAQFTRLGSADSVTTIDHQTEMALAIQAEEAQIVRDCLPGQQVIVAPLAIEPVDAPQPGSGSSVLFVGSNTAPNVIGLRWVFESMWCRIHASVPDARLEVAGSVCGAMGDPPDGVRLLGPVRDLAALYRDAAVVISPLLAGSGLKIKLVEALGQGKAVVATGVTLQGLSDCPPDTVAVADTAPEFAAAVIELLRDDARRAARARAGLTLARTRFSATACYAALLDVVLTTGDRRH